MRMIKFAVLGVPLALFVATASNVAHTAPAEHTVRVINTATEPVPVTDAVNLAGAMQAPRSGAGTVGVSGPLAMASSQNSLLFAPIIQPVRQVFSKRFFFSFVDGDATAGETFTIPAGKRFIVEHFSADVQATPRHRVWRLSVVGTADGETISHLFALTRNGTSHVGTTIYTVSQSVRMYLDSEPLSAPSVVADRSTTSGVGDAVVASLTGYLVDCAAAPCPIQ